MNNYIRTSISLKAYFFMLIAVACLISACSESYSAQYFSYPPESKPHESNWEYSGVVVMPDRSNYIRVRIVNRDNNELLNDEVKLSKKIKKASVSWRTRKHLEINLVDENAVVSSSSVTVKIVYELNFQTGVFHRIEVIESD